MPRHRKSFRFNLGDTVYVLWEDNMVKGEVSQITISGAGVYYTVKYEGRHRQFYDSHVARSASALGARWANKIKTD